MVLTWRLFANHYASCIASGNATSRGSIAPKLPPYSWQLVEEKQVLLTSVIILLDIYE